MRTQIWHRFVAPLAASAALAGVVALVPVAAQAPKAATPPAAKATFPHGQIVDNIVCATDAKESYALYLPSGYRPDRLWPILYTFDPRSHGQAAAEVFQAGAEKYGYIIASSNNSLSDGPLEPNVAAMRAMWTDTHSKLAIDDRRIYAAGFSGTVRSSCILAKAAPGSIQGIIAAGAGFPVEEPPTAKTAFSYYGTVGILDFNFNEVTQLDTKLDELGLPHRVEVFAGGHEWMSPELASRGIAWMELQAMKTGRRPTDAALVDGLWAEWKKEADALLAAGKPFPAYLAYRALARDFAGLRKGDAFQAVQAKADELGRKETVQREAKERDKRAQRDHDFLENAARILGTSLPSASPAADPATNREKSEVEQVVAQLQIEELKRKAKAQDGEEGPAAQRLLNSLSAQTAFYMPRMFVERKEYDRALWCLDIASRINPDNPGVWFSQASIHSRRGEKKKALDLLERAIHEGWDDRARLETDPAFEPIRQDPGFQQLLQKIAKAPPAAKG
ncbi:MAG TPA: tetratricopeptide repeat protein [Thermoanaerobaculia bacterium]